MGKYYQELDHIFFDYQLHSIPRLPGRWLRGPAIDTSRPFIACLGAAQTFGRFSHHPFPELLGEKIGMPVLNLGIGGAGPAVFTDPAVLDLLNKAELVVVQVLSGRSESNSRFDNRPAGGVTGVRVADGKGMRFDAFLADLLRSATAEVVQDVIKETRNNYVRNFVTLLKSIGRPKVLFWFSTRAPEYVATHSSANAILGAFPQLVMRTMIDQIRLDADAYVESISSEGLPQTLWPGSQPVDGTTADKGWIVNHYYPSPEMHRRAAELLHPVCLDLLKPKGPTRFIILSAERTGSNLIRFQLQSHPRCLAGGELFNRNTIQSDRLPIEVGQERSADLMRLRKSDPVEFLRRIFELGRTGAYDAVGFKLMYGHGVAFDTVRKAIAEDSSIYVIHIRRRNLLRRYLSHMRADLTGKWAQSQKALEPLPSIDPSLRDFLLNCDSILSREIQYADEFRSHPTLELYYEDFAETPSIAGNMTAEFLGLGRGADLKHPFEKSGIDSLRDAITNYDQLKAQVLRIAASFDE